LNISQDYPVIAAVSIGKKQIKQNDLECVNERKENLRQAAAGTIFIEQNFGILFLSKDVS
jgi:hypothetical protein